MSEFRYKAFLSYSHEDRQWARWLHRGLEGYRVPARLVGGVGLHGEVPARLHPVFRDREDLTAHADLGERISSALETSQFLIVICSKHAVHSKWVNQEIIAFKESCGEGRILSVIVDGEPFASDKGRPGEECLPSALRFRVGTDGEMSDIPCEPIAADARKTGDGKRGARLKIIAGMLGVELDDLVQRENQRRLRRQSVVTTASLVGMLAMSALTWFAVDARDEARTRQAQAEGLIEFMIGDLRDKLEPVGRLEVLDVVGKRALSYYGEQEAGNLSFDALGRRSRALHLIAEIENTRGNLDEAHKVFLEANETTAELLARAPDDGQRVYDHAQSIFWLGYVDWQRGNFEGAEVAFQTYLDLSKELVALDPTNGEWRAELGYAHSNIGTLLFQQGKNEAARSAFEEALLVSKNLYEASPDDSGLRYDLAQSYAWVADVEVSLSRRQKASEHRHREIDLYLLTLAEDPNDKFISSALVNARLSSGRLRLDQGDLIGAEEALSLAANSAAELLVIEPSNTKWVEIGVLANTDYARALLHLGRLDESRLAAREAQNLGRKLVAMDAKVLAWQEYALSAETAFLRVKIVEGISSDALGEAEALLSGFVEATAGIEETQSVRWAKIYLNSIVAQLLEKNGQAKRALTTWDGVSSTIQEFEHEMGDKGAAILVLANEHLGKNSQNASPARLPISNGYRHPDYTRTLWGEPVFK